MKDKNRLNMSDNSVDRLEKLKELTRVISDKYKKTEMSSEKFNWLMKHLKDTINLAKSDKCEKKDLLNMLEDIVCAVEEEDKDEQ